MLPRVHLLGIPLDPVTSAEAVAKIQAMLSACVQHHVMTPNAEMLVEAEKNDEFRIVLQKTSLNLPDSISLVWMARLTGQYLPERVTGVDTVMRLCRQLSAEHSVFLLGAAPGIAEKAAEILRKSNPRLTIVGTFSGSPALGEAQMIINRINATSPRLLLVAFGAPAQDLWIANHLSQLPSVRVAMGVGGTFDFLAGVRKRAPVIFQRIGLEWFWRLVQEPSRWRRMWRAVVVFPWMSLTRRY